MTVDEMIEKMKELEALFKQSEFLETRNVLDGYFEELNKLQNLGVKLYEKLWEAEKRTKKIEVVSIECGGDPDNIWSHMQSIRNSVAMVSRRIERIDSRVEKLELNNKGDKHE